MGGIAEIKTPPPSRCNIGSKMGKIALFVKINPEAIFRLFCIKISASQISCHTSEVLLIWVV